MKSIKKTIKKVLGYLKSMLNGVKYSIRVYTSVSGLRLWEARMYR